MISISNMAVLFICIAICFLAFLRTNKDAKIGRLVRKKMTSGNRIPVERCTIRADEIKDI